MSDLILQTCDILICSGEGKLPGRIKQYNRLVGVDGPAAEITHIALAAMAGLAVFESTTINPWADGGRGKRGTQINPFEDWLDNYPGRVWVRRLEFGRDDAFEMRAADVMGDRVGIPYESGIPGAMELALCGTKGSGMLRTVKLHCTENGVEVLQWMALMRSRDASGRNVNPSRMPPYQFWPGGRMDGLMICGIGRPELIKP